MPLYTMRCLNCGDEREYLVRDLDQEIYCGGCQGGPVEKMVSRSAPRTSHNRTEGSLQEERRKKLKNYLH
jgi:putative FmdB family regulatory protein